jgi:hypothetical protein
MSKGGKLFYCFIVGKIGEKLQRKLIINLQLIY